MKACVTSPIAIIGVGLRLPAGITDLDTLWRSLQAGKDCIRRIPNERWETERFYHPNRTHAGTCVTRFAGLLDDVYGFDADFFGISPKEASVMDPQQRILLELVWEAFEDAGLFPKNFSGSDTAVFVGAASPDAGTIHADDICATSPYSMTGTNLSIIANRISYIYNFHGPSFTLDTACSSSLYALYQACQSLAAGNASMAVCAGVNVLLAPYPFVGFSQAYMLSPQGRCRVFDARGDGYVRAEGGGVLLLEPLEKAMASGHPIRAVIRACAVNSDGRTQGIAMPSADAQEKLLRDCYSELGIPLDQLSYIEAHGTGTSVGDPIEAHAIGSAIGKYRKNPLPIGSVKCHVGHLETASGMAGIMKALCVLREKKIPAQIHIETLNPAIDFETLNLRVPLVHEDIPEQASPLLVGVNSFGFGGANAHVVLEEGREESVCVREEDEYVLRLQTRSQESLDRLAHAYGQKIREEKNIGALCEGAIRFRESMPCRLLVKGSREDLLSSLENPLSSPNVLRGDSPETGENPKTAFVYAGNGCHWPHMGRDLLENTVFSESIETVSKIFQSLSGTDFYDLFLHATESDLEKTEYTQPLIFMIQVALTKLLFSQGIRPDVVFGHSVGEVAAAWAAGYLSLEDAVCVVYYRSLAQAKTRGQGKMAAVKLSIQEILSLSKDIAFGEVWIAGINAPGSMTLSGSERGLSAFREYAARNRVFFRMLPLDYAFHSHFMDPVREELLASLSHVKSRSEGSACFLSSVEDPKTPYCATEEEIRDFGSLYWWRNIRYPVCFASSVQKALDLGVRYFLEISPHAILQQYLRANCKAKGIEAWIAASMQKKADNLAHMTHFWENAWIHGWPCSFPEKEARGIVHDLPHYPWNHKRYAIDLTPENRGYFFSKDSHPLLGERLYSGKIWENVLDTQKYPWLSDHKVGDRVFYPAACFLEMAIACGKKLFGEEAAVELQNCAILRPLIFDENSSSVVRLSYESLDGAFTIESRPFMQDAEWTLHVRGRLIAAVPRERVPKAFVGSPEQYGRPLSKEDHLARTQKCNMHYGPSFQPIERLWLGEKRVLARFEETHDAQWEKGMYVAPPLLDGGLQLIFPLLGESLETSPWPRLPYWFDRCVHYAKGNVRYAETVQERAGAQTVVCSVSLLDEEGRTLLHLENGRARSVARLKAPLRAKAYETRFFEESASFFPDISLELCLARAFEKAEAIRSTAHWRRDQEEVWPLLNIGAKAVLTEYAATLSQKNGQNLSHFEQFALHEREEDLPSFSLLFQTLWHDYPEKSSLVMPLLLAHAHLLGEEPFTLSEIPEIPLVDSFAIVQAFLEPFLDKSPSPLRFVEQGFFAQSLLSRLSHILSRHSLVSTCREDFRIEKLKAEIEQRGDASRHSADVWDFEREQRGEKAHGILLSNCLHKADNVMAALSLIRQSLFRHGFLVLIEKNPSVYDDLVHGLEESWWTQSGEGEAVGRRIEREKWVELLEKAKFSDVRSIPLCREDGEAEEFVIIARNEEEERTESASSEEIFLVERAVSEKLRTALSPHFSVHEECMDISREDAWKAFFARLGSEKTSTVLFSLGRADSYEDALSSTQALLAMAHAWAECGKPVQMNILSYGASAMECAGANCLHAASLGFCRVLANEMPNLHLRFLDLCEESCETSYATLCDSLQEKEGEREIFIRGRRRFFLRTGLATEKEREEDGEKLELFIADPPRLESLEWQRKAMPLLDEKGIRVRVAATGLNFRDVMWAMNLLPEEALENGFSGAGLGIECVGEIEAVGKRAQTSLRVGDHVLCFGKNCFASHVDTLPQACVRIPEEWDSNAAASVPVTFFTSYYSLVYLGHLEKGERVLIHGACGGVGLAAIQIAKHVGAEIFATAGSPLKRDALRLLGIDHVYDSRSTAFRDEILRDTEGEGVDLVLNSLAGEAMAQSLEIVKPFGRFFELGKSDFYANSALRLRPFRNNLSYFGIDVDQLMRARGRLGERVLHDMLSFFEEASLAPLPSTVYPSSEVESAFRMMQKSRHIGKIVVEAPREKSAGEKRDIPKLLSVQKNASYLVTGGLDGFGFESAKFLAQKGAESLILVSRHGETEKNTSRISALRNGEFGQGSVQVCTMAIDVTNEDKLRAGLESALKTLPPLRGIIHAAAFLEDSIISKMDAAMLDHVLGPKMKGLLALDSVTKDISLDFFLCYSSVTTLFGNPGQANYVAANTFLEEFMRKRISEGKNGCAVLWGAIHDTGMLRRDPRTLELLQKETGIIALSAGEALQKLGETQKTDNGMIALFSADFSKLAKLPIARDPRLSALISPEYFQREEQKSLSEMIQGKDAQEAYETVLHEVRECVARIVHTKPSSIKTHVPLQEMGIDSLMGVELSLQLEELLDGKSYGSSFSAHVTCHDIATKICAFLVSDASHETVLPSLAESHGMTMTREEAESFERYLAEDAK